MCRHSELWRHIRIGLVSLCSSPCPRTEKRRWNVLFRKDFSALKGLKWSYQPCMLLHQNTEQVVYKHLRRQHKAQYMCKNTCKNVGCEWHTPPEYMHKGIFSGDQVWQRLAKTILLHREELHLQKTSHFDCYCTARQRCINCNVSCWWQACS